MLRLSIINLLQHVNELINLPFLARSQIISFDEVPKANWVLQELDAFDASFIPTIHHLAGDLQELEGEEGGGGSVR